MKIFRLGLALSALGLGCLSSTALAEEETNLTLEDVIFDANYTAQFLGPKTILQLKEGDPTPVLEALAKSGLAEKTKFMQLPPQLKPAKPKYETPPNLPETRKWQNEESDASFLIYVSAEGKVESLYCYSHSDKIFALSVARAILKWRFNPAMYGDTALPVLYQHTATFRSIMNPTFRDASDGKNNTGSPANTPMPQSAPQ
ncbi:MAG: hypothetical protein H7A44_04290 [Opitutaceae bacterium]|nr:hypothetical protein [Opitutaceae bacterium]